MLVVKQASQKKIAAYGIVMLLMFSGTGYMLYNNFFKSSRPSGMDAVDMAMEIPGMEGAANLPGAEDTPDVPAVASNANKEEASVDFFSNPKYKKLKELIPEEANSKVGKANPFKPYE